MRRPSDQERDLGRRRKKRPRRLETCPKQALATASSVLISGSMTAAICGLWRPWPQCHHCVPLQVPVRERPLSRLGLGACGSVASWCGLPAPVAPVCPPSQGCARFCVVHWMPPLLPAFLPPCTPTLWHNRPLRWLMVLSLLFLSLCVRAPVFLMQCRTCTSSDCTHSSCSLQHVFHWILKGTAALLSCLLLSFSSPSLSFSLHLNRSVNLSLFLPLCLSPVTLCHRATSCVRIQSHAWRNLLSWRTSQVLNTLALHSTPSSFPLVYIYK